jgi:hypothetical protein
MDSAREGIAFLRWSHQKLKELLDVYQFVIVHNE